MGHAPISRFGVGQISGIGLARNEGMAGAGLAGPSQDHPNLLNPALLAFNEKVNLNFDLWYAFRSLKVPGAAAFETGLGGPRFVSISVPVKKGFTMAMGIHPFSSRDFAYSTVRKLGTDSLSILSRGTGGLARAFLAAGLRLHKNLHIGLDAGYIFGTLEDSVQFGILPQNLNFSFINIRKRKVSQVQFRPGIQFQIPVPGKEGVFIGAGFTADLGGKLKYKNYNTFSVDGISAETDTLDYESKSNIELTSVYKGGISYYKPLNWGIHAEAQFQPAGSADPEAALVRPADAFSYRLGFEISPGTKKSTRYVNIIMFRAGFAYETYPYQLNQKSISDKRVSIGASFPIIRKETKFSRPLINLGCSFGQRGLANSYVGVENYWQLNLSFSLNDFLWFNRYRID
jgi:hypothetical protein